VVTTNLKLVNKKVLIPVILSVGVMLSSSYMVSSFEVSSATPQYQSTTNYTKIGDYKTIPKINGSVSIEDGVQNLLKEGAKITYLAAVQTAQNQVTNGSVLSGYLGATQGYLTYVYDVVDTSTDNLFKVIVDAGDGHVLYKSEGHGIGTLKQPVFDSFGHEKGHGFGNGLWGGFGGFLHGLLGQ
jgi:uncharacterized membrane protein YkoI